MEIFIKYKLLINLKKIMSINTLSMHYSTIQYFFS